VANLQSSLFLLFRGHSRISVSNNLGKKATKMKSGILAKSLVFGSLTLCLMASPRFSSALDQPRRIEVQVKKFAYTPGELSLKKGEPVVLVLTSEDVAHGLKFKELNLVAKFEKDKPAELAFTPDKVGNFVGHCSVFCGSGHGSMTLTLHITE
jgi:cytochrome c oxidase subunit II